MRRSTHHLAIALLACRPAGPPAEPSPATEQPLSTRQIVTQLERAASDWNRGDLDGFLSDYAPESTTTFVDGRRARHGFDFIRDNYARWFVPGARRDSLRFEEVEVRPLGPNHALVTARFVFDRNEAVTSSGPFTLVMERRSGGWKILHDHSSSDPR